jgi:hypothetical protein
VQPKTLIWVSLVATTFLRLFAHFVNGAENPGDSGQRRTGQFFKSERGIHFRLIKSRGGLLFESFGGSGLSDAKKQLQRWVEIEKNQLLVQERDLTTQSEDRQDLTAVLVNAKEPIQMLLSKVV